MRPAHQSNIAALFAMFLPLIVAGCGSTSGSATPQPTATPTPGFHFTALVSDTPDTARQTDRKLVNPWGIAFSESGPFLVVNNGTNIATIYDGGDTASLPSDITIMGASGPTGVEFNQTNEFIAGDGIRQLVIFATEGGTLNGWSMGRSAGVVVDQAGAGAVYKGLAMAASGNQHFLFATDFHNARIDRFDGSFHLVNSFTDPNIPAGFAPFGIRTINNLLYVTYAKQKGPDNVDDDPGAGNGYIDVFHADGTLVRRLVSQGPLNSPWGMALAPAGFGVFGGKLLVGNFGDGRIHAFDPTTGALIGEMQEDNAHPMIIPGLWALSFGDGNGVRTPNTLYITAGPDDEAHGIFATISVQ